MKVEKFLSTLLSNGDNLSVLEADKHRTVVVVKKTNDFSTFPWSIHFTIEHSKKGKIERIFRKRRESSFSPDLIYKKI